MKNSGADPDLSIGGGGGGGVFLAYHAHNSKATPTSPLFMWQMGALKRREEPPLGLPLMIGECLQQYM